MSALLELLSQSARWHVVERTFPHPPAPETNDPLRNCAADNSSVQQIRGLVQQVFLSNLKKQAVFCAADEKTETASVCAQVSKAMAELLSSQYRQ